MKGLRVAISCISAFVLLCGMFVGTLPAFAEKWTETQLMGNGFDYGFAITEQSEDVSYLDDDFTVYQYNRTPASTSAADAINTLEPTDAADSTFNAVFTNGLTGFKVHSGTGGFGVMTYKTEEYTDFYAEYAISGYLQAFGLAFGLPLGNMGVANDTDATNDTAVYVRVRETGATVTGAVDPDATENVVPNVFTTNVLSGILGENLDFVSTDSIKLTASNSGTATICVSVKDGFVSVWKKDAPATVLKVKLSNAYTGGHVGLFMSNTSGAMFTSFGIREAYDYEMAVTGYSEDVSYLDDDFTVYHHSRTPATASAAAATATYKPTDAIDSTYNAVFTNGIAGFKINATALSVMTYKTKEYTDFYAEYGVSGYNQGVGLAFGLPLGNLGIVNDTDATNDTAVYIRIRETGLSVTGAVNPSSTENVVPNVFSTNVLSGVLGANLNFVSTDSISVSSATTVCISVKDGFVSVWEKDAPATVLKVKLSDAYTGGHVGLYMANSSGPMFTSFCLRGDKTEETVGLDTVYLSSDGDDINAGDTAETAVATLAKAMELVKDGGTINVVGTYVLNEFVESAKAVTFTGDTLDLSGQTNASGTTGWVRLYSPVTFGDITVKFKANANLLAQCNKLVVSADATIDGTINVFGGYQLSSNAASYTADTHIELYAGTYGTVGGANRCGKLIGDTCVKFGGQASVTNLYGGTAGDWGNVDGETYVYVEGGGVGNLFGGHQYSGTVNGTHVYVSGGSIENVYGGNAANNMKYTDYATNGKLASVEVVLSGGTVTRRVYGGCYNDVTTTNKNKVYGTITVTVKEGFTFGTHASWEGIRAGSRTSVADYETDCAETTTLAIDNLAAYTAMKAYLHGADSSSLQQYNIVDTTDTLNLPEGAENGEITVSSVDNGNGTVTSTITVTPKEGYELQAGSLLAKDASGNLYVPTRLGFRDTMDGTKYIVVASSAVTVNGTFVQPTKEQPNIGNLGNSVHTGTSGLRFISRVNRTIESNVAYVTLSGEKKAIKDYGMLVAAEVMLDGEELTLALMDENPYVVKASIWDKNVYYDYCNEYVDMSVRIINIESQANGGDINFVARPYVVYDDGTESGAILYGAAWDCTYNEAAQNKNSPMTDLAENKQVVTVGRASIVDGVYAMDNVQSGFKVSGYLQGAVKAEIINEKYTDIVNVIVDGKLSTVEVPQGTSTVTLATGLTYGEHTIEVQRASSVYEQYNGFAVNTLDYNGSLGEIAADDARLKIEVLGDSISCGYGLDYTGSETTFNTLATVSNSYYTYAAQTARALDADLSTVAWCSKTIADINSIFSKTTYRDGAEDWDFAGNQADIVIINLGTNDEAQNVGADTALANAKTLLTNVREAYPHAYVIWVYGMMRKDYEDSVYKAAIEAMNDDKMFCIDMTDNKNPTGSTARYGHPLRACHTATAEDLVAFIKANCNVQVKTMADLDTADTVKYNGRTTKEGTARSMHFGNTGITLSGYLYGDMVLDVTKNHSMGHVNVVIDGDYDNVTTHTLSTGDHELVIYEDLAPGNHTVEILYGTSRGASATLVMKSVTYAGTLTKPADKDLQIEFIGDSITVGEGMWTEYTNSERLDSYNNFYGYAPRTGRALDADITLSAICGYTTKQMREYFNRTTYDSGYQQKDIVVINLCTNDVWSLVSSNTANRDEVLTEVTGLLTDVRAAYPDAHIVWAFGSMPVMSGGVDQVTKCLDYVKDTVEAFAENDEKVYFCDMTPVKNDEGVSDHPDYDAHIEQSAYLLDFIRENCADALS